MGDRPLTNLVTRLRTPHLRDEETFIDSASFIEELEAERERWMERALTGLNSKVERYGAQPCGCLLTSGRQTHECDFHVRQRGTERHSPVDSRDSSQQSRRAEVLQLETCPTCGSEPSF
jgi:hypothetical protein